MDDDYTQSLMNRFPELFERNIIEKRKPQIFKGINCGNGWYHLVWELAYIIERISNYYNFQPPKLEKIIQKNGKLIVKLKNYNKNLDDGKIERAIKYVQNWAQESCEVCSKVGELRLDIVGSQVLCKKHYNKKQKSYLKLLDNNVECFD